MFPPSPRGGPGPSRANHDDDDATDEYYDFLESDFDNNTQKSDSQSMNQDSSSEADKSANDELLEEGMIYSGVDYSVNFHRYINVREVGRLDFAGGAARETVYRVHFDFNWSGVLLRDIIGGLENVLQGILERLRDNYNPQDLVRFFFQNDAFYSPHSLGLIPLHQINIFQLMDMLQNLVQSDSTLFIDKPLEIHIGVIRNPLGGTKPLGLNYLSDIASTRGVCQIHNSDNLCLARALVVANAWTDLSECQQPRGSPEHRRLFARYELLKRKTRTNLQDAVSSALHRNAGFDLNYIPALTDINAFEVFLNVRVVVFGLGAGSRPLYVGSDDRSRTLYILHVDNPMDKNSIGHYHCIKNVACIFGKTAFCQKCLVPYDKRYGHKSCNNCRSCKSLECEIVDGEKHTCMTCKRFMRSEACRKRHVETGVCATSHRCTKCNTFFHPEKGHKCESRVCDVCKCTVEGLHMCYIRQKQPKDINPKLMYADFEADPTERVHVPNLIIGHWQCQHCILRTYREDEYCKHCGNACTLCKESVNKKAKRGDEGREVCMNAAQKCGKRGVSFFGANAAIDFCRFFFARDFEKYTLIFHNGQAYDVYFIARYIFSTMRGIPRVIYRGSKIVLIQNNKFRVIDSLNFLSFPLAQMPKVFG